MKLLESLGLGQPWYVILFGCKKAYQGVLAAVCGMTMWFTIPPEVRKMNILQFLAFFAACFTIYTIGDLKAKAMDNKNGGGANAGDKG